MNKYCKIIGNTLGTMIGRFLFVLINAALGYLTGLILKGWLSDGLNALFNTTRFTDLRIPMICATLMVVCSYIKITINITSGGKADV